MSTFSHTDWTVICNGMDGDEPCPLQYGPDGLSAAELRVKAKRAGWVVNVPNPDSHRRLDFCPRHKPDA